MRTYDHVIMTGIRDNLCHRDTTFVDIVDKVWSGNGCSNYPDLVAASLSGLKVL